MPRVKTDLPELTDEELAFEMIEITCDEMDSLSRAFEMISKVCREINGEEADAVESSQKVPEGGQLH